MNKFWIALFSMAAMLPLYAAEYLVEAEAFPTDRDVRLINDEVARNGAFIHFQVENASTEQIFILPQTGDFAVWLRTMSFNGNFRKTQIFLNGKLVATLGDSTPENNRSGSFTWYHAPALTHLGAGSLKIKLVSTSPYTRVDALLLTTDTKLQPQGKMEKVMELKKLSK